jgi:hypothetical protein
MLLDDRTKKKEIKVTLKISFERLLKVLRRLCTGKPGGG